MDDDDDDVRSRDDTRRDKETIVTAYECGLIGRARDRVSAAAAAARGRRLWWRWPTNDTPARRQWPGRGRLPGRRLPFSPPLPPGIVIWRRTRASPWREGGGGRRGDSFVFFPSSSTSRRRGWLFFFKTFRHRRPLISERLLRRPVGAGEHARTTGRLYRKKNTRTRRELGTYILLLFIVLMPIMCTDDARACARIYIILLCFRQLFLKGIYIGTCT